jgi:hypothetical protein
MRWFVLDAATLTEYRPALEARHVEACEGAAALSVAPNRDGTRFLVKVNGADKAWRQSQPWIGNVVAIFDRNDHTAAQALLQTADWSGEPAEAGTLPV